jgi:hypothetical protein
MQSIGSEKYVALAIGSDLPGQAWEPFKDSIRGNVSW